jgi:hypothetical protein
MDRHLQLAGQRLLDVLEIGMLGALRQPTQVDAERDKALESRASAKIGGLNTVDVREV